MNVAVLIMSLSVFKNVSVIKIGKVKKWTAFISVFMECFYSSAREDREASSPLQDPRFNPVDLLNN